MLEALCAWTTGPLNLLRGSLSKATVPIELSIILPPRTPITSIPVEVFTTRWAMNSQWPADATVSTPILDALNKANKGRAPIRGAVHCEAALMASLLHHSSAKRRGDSKESVHKRSERAEAHESADTVEPAARRPPPVTQATRIGS
jgi:hypothetical protein